MGRIPTFAHPLFVCLPMPMLAHVSATGSFGRILLLCGAVGVAAVTAPVGCAKDDDGSEESGSDITAAATSHTGVDGGATSQTVICSVPLSTFAQQTVSTLEQHFCDDAKSGDNQLNAPTTSAVQKEKDAIFLDLAFAVVDKRWDTTRGHAIAAVLVDGDDTVSKTELNSDFAEVSAIDHAEVRSLREFFADMKTNGSRVAPSEALAKATMYGTLEPCQMCAGTINMARVSRAVFGLKDNHFGDVMNYLHSEPYYANFELNTATRASTDLTAAINASPTISLTTLMDKHRAQFAEGTADLASFQLQHTENTKALANARAALAALTATH